MSLANANAVISAIDGAARQAQAALQALPLGTAVRLAALGADADYLLHYGAGTTLAANSVLAVAGGNFRVVRCRNPLLPDEPGEALLKQIAAPAPNPAPGPAPTPTAG